MKKNNLKDEEDRDGNMNGENDTNKSDEINLDTNEHSQSVGKGPDVPLCNGTIILTVNNGKVNDKGTTKLHAILMALSLQAW